MKTDQITGGGTQREMTVYMFLYVKLYTLDPFLSDVDKVQYWVVLKRRENLPQTLHLFMQNHFSTEVEIKSFTF